MSAKRVYSGKNLINNSWWVYYFINYRVWEIKRLCSRTEELMAENPQFCDEANFYHMSNAFTAIGMYELFLSRGNSRKDAWYLLEETMEESVREENKKIRRKSKIPFVSKRLFKKTLPEDLKSRSGYGWKDELTLQGSNVIRWECSCCVYKTLFDRYGLPELRYIFCRADELKYEGLKDITFKRDHSLAIDGKSCDFLIERK